jgi:hypothetical protein
MKLWSRVSRARLLAVLALLACADVDFSENSAHAIHFLIGKPATTDCGDGRWTFARLQNNRQVQLNLNTLPEDSAIQSIKALMEPRAERILYIMADRAMTVGQFAVFAEKISAEVDDLHLVLTTDRVAQAARQTCVVANWHLIEQ